MPWLFGLTRRPRRWKDSVPITSHPNYAHFHYGDMDECGATITDEQLQDLIADAQIDHYMDPDR